MTQENSTSKKKEWVPGQPVHRPSSRASRFHMSNKAVDVEIDKIGRMTDLACVHFLAKARWGDHENVICPHCSTGATHYWSSKALRWKCKSCGKRFSVTSKTAFSNRKISLQKLISAIHLWACGASGKSALELRRALGFKGYNTAFTLLMKLREALTKGFNTGLVVGVVEMDGAHSSGRRASERRGLPLKYGARAPQLPLDEKSLTSSGRTRLRRAAKKARERAASEGYLIELPGNVPPDRRIVMTVRGRSEVEGGGADVTRVGVGRAENPEFATALAEKFVCPPESILATDTGTAFFELGKKFSSHEQVNHSECLVDANGHHNNFAESFTARQDRAEKGVYINIEPKYSSEYVVETAFREDHRRVAPGKMTEILLYYALNCGLSEDWRSFTHGHHRNFENLTLERRPAKPSGPRKGKFPVAGKNGRPPR